MTILRRPQHWTSRTQMLRLESLGKIWSYSTTPSEAQICTATKKSQGPTKDVPIISAATAYDCADTNETYILVFNEYLWFGGQLNHSLHNPNQIRHNGHGFWDNPYDIARGLEIEAGPITISLRQQGTKLGFVSRVPTKQELQNCTHINMTSVKQWNSNEV